MDFVGRMKTRARELARTLVLPEGTEPRTIAAARAILDDRLAGAVVLLGSGDAIASAAAAAGVDLSGVTITDPTQSSDRERYALEYVELRKHKGVTLEQARDTITDPLRWGAMMVRLDDAHAMVAGAENSTGNVLRAAFEIVKTAPGTAFASSCFVMRVPNSPHGEEGHFIFSDCATIPDPTAEQLAEIAAAAATSCRTFLRAEPRVAMLSFSTKGSASHPAVDKVVDALNRVRAAHPDLEIDGELQLDAAIIASVGEKKAPGSSVAGKANTLVFPDLNSGNVGYKLVQRLAGADAWGPFLQGFAKPVSDLSRGCSVDDIVTTAAVTMCQSDS